MARTTSRFVAILALTIALSRLRHYRARLAPLNVPSRRQDYDRAVAEYTAALKKHPNDRTTQLALQRAKLRASQDHLRARAGVRSDRQTR